MQIKGVQFERMGLGFKLSPTEVQRANERLKKELVHGLDNYRASMGRVMGNYPQYAEEFGDLSVPYFRVNCDSSYSPNKPYPSDKWVCPNNAYNVEISFRPSARLTMELMRALVHGANEATGLGFSPTRRDMFYVTPSGLVYFKEPWSYIEKPGRASEQHVVRVKFFGAPNEIQIDKLREMADDVYLPQKQRHDGRDYFNTEFDRRAIFGSFATGQNHPVVAIDRSFGGSFTRESEDVIADFYVQIRDFILDSGLTKDCVGVNGEPLSADTDVEKSVASSSLGERGKYAPKINILLTKPEIIVQSGYGDYSMVVRSDRDSLL